MFQTRTKETSKASCGDVTVEFGADERSWDWRPEQTTHTEMNDSCAQMAGDHSKTVFTW